MVWFNFKKTDAILDHLLQSIKVKKKQKKHTHTNTRSSVECWDHCDKIKTITEVELDQRYPALTTHILAKL